MLMGEYQHALDGKGRLTIPAKFREVLGDSFVLTRGMEGCVFGYSVPEWEKLEGKLTSLPLNRKEARMFMRFFYSAASVCSLDKQGRILVPQTLRTYADIQKECTVIGVVNRIEIWDHSRWTDYNQAAGENFDELAEKMMDFEL